MLSMSGNTLTNMWQHVGQVYEKKNALHESACSAARAGPPGRRAGRRGRRAARTAATCRRRVGAATLPGLEKRNPVEVQVDRKQQDNKN